MKATLYALPIALACLSFAGCSSSTEQMDYPFEEDLTDAYIDSSAGDDLESFDIVADYSALDESETIPSDESDDSFEDYVENSTFNKTVTISYSDGAATVSGDTGGVTVSVDGAHVTVSSESKKMEYVLTGSASDGSFKIYSNNKFKLTLNGVSLTNPTGAAVNVQSKKRVFVVLADGTENSLTDGASYNTVDGEDMKACFFSEGQLLFSGGGTLNVTGKCKHGICSDDYIRVRPGVKLNISATVSNGMKSNDGVFINGGTLNIDVSGTAAKGISSDADVRISGGRTTVMTSGGGELGEDDVSACAGVKCDSAFLMTGGQLLLKSTGAGGKGISSDGELTISGGDIKVITTGKQYVYGRYDTSPKGIKSDGDLTISGGSVKVRTSGGEGSEGIESKARMSIEGGTVEVSSYDDALNASSAISVSGGSVYAFSSNNDGIDSNGTLSISGGTVVSVGTKTPEGGFDCDQSNFSITGGTVVGIGGDCSTPTTSSTKQPVVLYQGSGTAGMYLSLYKSASAPVMTYKMPVTYSQMTMLLSSAGLSTGTAYTLSVGGKISGGTTFHGLTTGGTWSDGASETSLSLSSMVTSVGSSGMGGMTGGGNQPGGMGGQGGRR